MPHILGACDKVWEFEEGRGGEGRVEENREEEEK